MRGRKYSIAALFVLTASIAVILSFRTSYVSEHEILIKLSNDSQIEQYSEMGRWITPPPSVVAYTEWKGPVFMESLMREYQIPWFDRIARIDFYDASLFDSQQVINLKQCYYLRTVVLHGNCRDIRKVLSSTLGEGVVILDSNRAPGYQLK